MSWEDTFTSWAKPPGKTEQEKCDNAENAVREAIGKSLVLLDKNVSVFPQGSYYNRTNIRTDSDVDLCVLCTDSFFYELPDGFTAANFGISTPADYPHSAFRGHVHEALNSHFGTSAVHHGNKAFDIHENSSRVDADAVPCFEYRWYRNNGSYITGTAFLSKEEKRIINWPEQSYQNGKGKNERTGRRYRAAVRILKNLRNRMQEEKITDANDIASFLIESLVWNVPDDSFGHSTLTDDIRDVLAHTFNNTMTSETCKEWREVNKLKYLFRDAVQPWTLSQTHGFLDAAWDYIGFK